MLLTGRRALVTGAAGQIGEAVANRLASEGCAVTLADINSEGANAAAHRLKEKWSTVESIEAVRLDVTDEGAVQACMAHLGNLDILVNNAGVTRSGFVEDITLRQWHEVLDVNLTSAFLCSKYALPLLRRSKAPAIVNVASNNAILMNPSLPAYTASKSALIALTQQLAIEGAGARIRANCVSPGLTVDEAGLRRHEAGSDYEIERDCCPLGRLGNPEDVANVVLFLASDLSAFVNGTNLVVDGGMSIQAVSGLVRTNLRKRWKKGVYRLEFEGEKTSYEPL